MVALVWIISVLTNILNPIGLFAFFMYLSEGDTDLFILPLIMGGIGLVYGFATFGFNVAPRMFWVKSKVGIFDMRVGAAFGYGLAFFNSVLAIMLLSDWLL